MTRLLVTLALLTLPRLALAQTEEVRYFHSDASGSVRLTTDENGQVIERYDYLPFGEAYPSSASLETRRFGGKERDNESGLDYFGARYYSSGNGRFTTVDPVYTLPESLFQPQRWNRYAYGLNNPTRFVDAFGLYVTTCVDGDKQCAQDAADFEKARQRHLKSSNPLIRAAAEAYGNPGVDNGVVVSFAKLPGNKAGDATPSLAPDSSAPALVRLKVAVTIDPNLPDATTLESVVIHEGAHVVAAQRLYSSFKPDLSYTPSLNITRYDNETSAWLLTHAVLNAANVKRGYGTCGAGSCILGAGVLNPKNVIDQLLANPANGYGGVTAQNPGPRMFSTLK